MARYYGNKTGDEIDREIDDEGIWRKGAKDRYYAEKNAPRINAILNKRREEKKAELEEYMKAPEELRALFSLYGYKTNPEGLPFNKWRIVNECRLSKPLNEYEKAELKMERMQWAKGVLVYEFTDTPSEICYYTMLKKKQERDRKETKKKLAAEEEEKAKAAQRQAEQESEQSGGRSILKILAILFGIGLVACGVIIFLPVILHILSIIAVVAVVLIVIAVIGMILMLIGQFF